MTDNSITKRELQKHAFLSNSIIQPEAASVISTICRLFKFKADWLWFNEGRSDKAWFRGYASVDKTRHLRRRRMFDLYKKSGKKKEIETFSVLNIIIWVIWQKQNLEEELCAVVAVTLKNVFWAVATTVDILSIFPFTDINDQEDPKEKNTQSC